MADTTSSTTPPPLFMSPQEEAEATLRDLRAQVPASMRVPSRAGRAVHTYPVPDAFQQEVGLRSIGLVELTADEEMAVMGRVRGATIAAGVKAQYDLAKASVAMVNGLPVSSADGTLEEAWIGLRPKARMLVLRAYQDLHNVAKELESGFLKGRTTSA